MISSYAGKTDKGKVRTKNEDSWGAFPEQGLFLVADGIGGMPAGDMASKLVADVLPPLLAQRIEEPESLSSNEIILILKQALIDLSNRILQESEHRPEFAGMGTTVVMALLTQNSLYIAHLGDSRAYLLKGDVLQQVTNDHTLVRHLLMTKEITQEQANNHPGKNQLIQYIGMSGLPSPDVICLPRSSGERLLLCSDGLTNMLSNQDIKQCLSKFSPPEHICTILVKIANQNGGKDNITAVLVDID